MLVNLVLYCLVLATGMSSAFLLLTKSRAYGYLGAIVGMILGLWLAIPNFYMLPLVYLTVLDVSYANLNGTDLSDPYNATFLMYVSILPYVFVSVLSIVRTLIFVDEAGD